MELGAVVSSQVLKELPREEANLAHCMLGPRGTAALAAALAANAVTKRLLLEDNQIDAQARLRRGLPCKTHSCAGRRAGGKRSHQVPAA